jgi:hypothetical protein
VLLAAGHAGAVALCGALQGNEADACATHLVRVAAARAQALALLSSAIDTELAAAGAC